jgi:arylsulfatase A-like enzyme
MRVGIFGATGQLGGVMREVLAEREFPVDELRLFASERSAGSKLSWQGREVVVEDAATAGYASRCSSMKLTITLRRVGLLRPSAALLAALTVGMVSCGQRPAREQTRPDIILVSIDSLRSDHLGCYGYARDTSPTIDGLAAQGARFVAAMSTTSWTLPAHAALFTGLFDATHGATYDGIRLSDEHMTLAEVLRQAGYHTAGFFGGPYLHSAFGLAQGFTHYQSCMTRIADDLPDDEVRGSARDASHADVTGPRLLEEVRGWLGTLGSGPFFLFVHMWDVHFDYIPPPGYAERFDPDYAGSANFTDLPRNPEVHAGMPQREREHLVALYDGEIRFTDEVLGKLLAELDRHGRFADALVVVTADHGEEFFEHGNKGHRGTLYDEVVRIPLVIRWPGHIGPGLVIEEPVQIVDLMPTLLALAGVELPVAVQGRDLSPLLEGGEISPAPALLDLQRGRHNRLQGLRTRENKLLVSSPGGTVLFDLVRDPRELHPRREPHDALEAARLELEGRLAAARAFRDGLGERGGIPTPIGREMRERLRSLGYLEAPTPAPAPQAEPRAAP